MKITVMKDNKLALILSLVLLLNLFGCGSGGGGGGEFIGAAIVSLDVSPQEIDTGDRALVRTFIAEAHENGIALKFKLPVGVVYVLDSAILEVEGEELDVSPTVNTTVDTDVFLVFYMKQSKFGENNTGTLTFEVEAEDEITAGTVEVDADIDDPDIDNASEFVAETPEFGAEDTEDLVVVG